MKIISNVVFFLVIIITFILYLDLLINNPDSKRNILKRNKNIIEFMYEGNSFKVDFNTKTILEIKVFKDLLIIPDSYQERKIYNIDVAREIFSKSLIIEEGIKKIKHLRILTDDVKATSFKVIDDLIFDSSSNLLVITSLKREEELKEIADKYSVSRYALDYFTNAIYHQAVDYKKMFDLRLSYPYHLKEEKLYLITPAMIDLKRVESISINYSYVKYLYIPKYVKRVILEKKSEYEKIEISKENKVMRIYGHNLCNKETKKFVGGSNYSFHEVLYFDKLDLNIKYQTLFRVKNCRYMSNKKK